MSKYNLKKSVTFQRNNCNARLRQSLERISHDLSLIIDSITIAFIKVSLFLTESRWHKKTYMEISGSAVWNLFHCRIPYSYRTGIFYRNSHFVWHLDPSVCDVRYTVSTAIFFHIYVIITIYNNKGIIFHIYGTTT